LPTPEQARRAGPLDDVQRRRDDRRRLHGRRGRDLHVLERRLPRLVPTRARRLLPAPPRPTESTPTVQAARVDEVRRAGARGVLRGDLLLRRACVRLLLVLARGPQHARLLLYRDRHAALVPAALLVPQEGRGQEARGGGAYGSAEPRLLTGSDGAPEPRRPVPHACRAAERSNEPLRPRSAAACCSRPTAGRSRRRPSSERPTSRTSPGR